VGVYKINLKGVIADDWEANYFGDEGLITLKQVETELKNAGGQDIEVDFSSVGGLVSVGVDIFFAFRDYKRANPQAQMQLNMKSQIASMASHIASGEFWDMITAEDITSWMIHNPSMYGGGDYKAWQAGSEYLERLAVLYSGSYIKRSKKSEKEIRSMMDKTTYLFGDEIVKAGFADILQPTAEEKNGTAMIAQMELKYKSIMQKISQRELQENDYLKAVAKLKDEPITMQKPAESGKNKIQEDVKMNFDEVKTKHPDTFAEIEKAGVSMERERVGALIEMKKRKDFEGIPAIIERIDEGIAKGETMQTVELGLMALLTKNSVQAAMESAGDINTGGSSTVSGESDNQTKKEVRW
jgi:ATP-dependent protease ClpP protease subunit